MITQEHCKLIIFVFISRFFKPPSSNLLQSVLWLILPFVEYHKKTFWISFHFNIEFGTVASIDKYIVLEISNVLKIRILRSKVSILVFHTLRAFYIFLTVLQKLRSALVSLCYEKCIPSTLIASLVKSTVFKPQTASRSRFRGPKPAISHFAIFGFNSEKQENSLKVLTHFNWRDVFKVESRVICIGSKWKCMIK